MSSDDTRAPDDPGAHPGGSAPGPQAGPSRRGKRRSTDLGRAFIRLSRSARNAVEVMRLGRLGAPYLAPFDVVIDDRTFKLRHYLAPTPGDGASAPPRLGLPVLLVPPLMLTSEVYDISPELSAVTLLGRAGIDVWLVDFGAPERIEGGLERTLDDHVRAIDRSIDEVCLRTGAEAVHLAGYSQGGMFCYQAAAFRRSHKVRSLITFGSPVDIRRNVPWISTRAAEYLIAFARGAIEPVLERIEALPGFLTSTGFKLLSARKEVQQIIDFVQNLHDRNAIIARESRRRFLAGEGFVAWPGPAFRKFVDEFIVSNRLASGGFVIDGRTVTLADITCPILIFVGSTDEIARAASVRAIRTAAPAAEHHEIGIRAGHFGLVVGSRAVTETWPAVIDWVRWRDAEGPRPRQLEQAPPRALDVDDESFDEVAVDIEAFYDVATSAIDAVWDRAEALGKELGDLIDSLRWQVPRLQKLRRIDPDTRISMSLALAEQASAIPDSTFFLWKGRAFTYRDADRRVDAVVKGLIQCGITKGTRVGVLMASRPSYLSIVCALNRVGAVAILLSPSSTRITLEQAVSLAPMDFVVSDPEHAAQARRVFPGKVLSLGGGPPGSRDGARPLPEGVLDMETIDPDKVALPPGFVRDPGQASDLAMIIFTAGRALEGRNQGKGELPKAAKITNRRWAMSALGAAASCALTTSDTVYCCLPLHHAAGILVAAGGALVGGSRLAVTSRFEPEAFWPEVRRYGASVVFYAGDMLRDLIEAPPTPLDPYSPVRLFAGSGIRTDVWERLITRFGRASVLEFYASTEGNAVLANTSGKKVGALGRPLPGSTDLALIGWSFGAEDFARDAGGQLLTTSTDEPGLLIARIDPSHPLAGFDGYEEAGGGESARRVLRDVFEPGDAWFVTGDMMRRDREGDFWFVDRLADVVRSAGGPIPTIGVEDALARLPGVRRAAAFGTKIPSASEQVLVAAVELRDGDQDLDALARDILLNIEPTKRPRFVRVIDRLPLTDGYRIPKAALRERGVVIDDAPRLLAYDTATESYVRLSAASWIRYVGGLARAELKA